MTDISRTGPPGFPIQVAENEGMPPGRMPNSAVPPVARGPRPARTPTMGPSNPYLAKGGSRPAKETPMSPPGTSRRHPLARVFSRLVALAGLLASIAFPVFAQDVRAPMPAHAQPKSYGEGWECDRGYRRAEDECLAVRVPANAFATNRTYGAGWECLHGFLEGDDSTCHEVVVPDGGYLDPSGQSWSCLRGYIEVDDLCPEIVLPPNAYLSDKTQGSAWACDRGYRIDGGTCVKIAVPENAFLNGSGYGQPWTCERGYFKHGDLCEAVAVPENAFFDDASYGPRWTCNRGFAASDDGCTQIDLPDNAHLDRSGNRWECHDNFQRSQGRCVLNE